jgi:hypothetical protein
MFKQNICILVDIFFEVSFAFFRIYGLKDLLTILKIFLWSFWTLCFGWNLYKELFGFFMWSTTSKRVNQNDSISPKTILYIFPYFFWTFLEKITQIKCCHFFFVISIGKFGNFTKTFEIIENKNLKWRI